MSTNATIKIKGVMFAKIYKHWDGYPEATQPFLEKFNKEFTENRGDDPEYKFAQLLRATKRLEKEFDLDSSDTTGWGVIPFNSRGSEEFEYMLEADGKVTVTKIK